MKIDPKKAIILAVSGAITLGSWGYIARLLTPDKVYVPTAAEKQQAERLKEAKELIATLKERQKEGLADPGDFGGGSASAAPDGAAQPHSGPGQERPAAPTQPEKTAPGPGSGAAHPAGRGAAPPAAASAPGHQEAMPEAAGSHPPTARPVSPPPAPQAHGAAGPEHAPPVLPPPMLHAQSSPLQDPQAAIVLVRGISSLASAEQRLGREMPVLQKNVAELLQAAQGTR